MCLIHYAAKARFYDNLKREAILRSVSISCKLFHIVNRMLTKSLHLFSGILCVIRLVLMNTPSYTHEQEHMVLNHLRVESRLR